METKHNEKGKREHTITSEPKQIDAVTLFIFYKYPFLLSNTLIQKSMAIFPSNSSKSKSKKRSTHFRPNLIHCDNHEGHMILLESLQMAANRNRINVQNTKAEFLCAFSLFHHISSPLFFMFTLSFILHQMHRLPQKSLVFYSKNFASSKSPC